MRKIVLIASLLVAVSVSAASHYPDSVQQASKAEPNIAYGWNFEFAGGLGVGSYTYQQIGKAYTNTDRHVTNKVNFPSWNAAFGLSYYFVPWMGLGTGVQFSAYPNKAAITEPWVTPQSPMLKDPFGDDYILTSTPENLVEKQTIHMLEIPIALKFRARPGVVGFTGTAGIKLGLPINNRYQLSDGMIRNSVYYPLYDLTIQDVPTVVENLPITGTNGSLPIAGSGASLRKLNYAAYMELGMLIRLQQRVELAISAYANYYFNDVMDGHSTAPLAFADGRTTGEYPMPYTTPYNGILRTNEVESLHPWSVGLKLGLQINANRTKAQRDYDRDQRRIRREQREAEREEQRRLEEERRLLEEQQKQMEDSIAEITPIDTVPTVVELTPREQAIQQIIQLADSFGIDICNEFCRIHDTVYVYLYRDPEPTPVIKEDPVAKQLDDMLKKAVIFFDLDKAIPILEPEDILIRIAEILKNHPDQKIHVNGHACKLGKPDYNQRLALRRAKAVAEQLKALGVREDQMIVASLGDDIPYRYQGQHQLSKDRRVEIVPTYRTTEIVRPGSRLAQIARRHYGNPEYWVFIYEANRDQIVDPSDLTAGIEIEIPNLSERLKGMTEAQIMEEVEQIKATFSK